MSNQYSAVDKRILDLIDEIRAQRGACTTGHIAARTGMSRDVIRVRCGILREMGLVEWSDAAGSLRRVVDTSQRLFTELIAGAVIAEAASSESGLSRDELAVRSWCVNLMAETKATVWPGPGGQEIPEPEPTVSVALAPPSEPTTKVKPRCEPCGRDFMGLQQLQGHERSKLHLARLRELGLPIG